MADDLNALGLMLVLLLTAVILVRFGRWSASFLRVATGCVAGFGLFLLTACFTTVLDYEANPIHQWLIPSVCLAVLITFTAPGRIRNIAATAIALSAVVWSFHYLCLLGPDSAYTGSPYWARRRAQATSRSHLRVINEALKVAAEADNHSYPAGWVSESEVGRLIPSDSIRYTRSRSVET
jgi:hypothetical protein